MRLFRNPRLAFLARVSLSLALLVWVFSRVNMSAALGALRNLSVFSLGFALLLYLAAQVLSSIRWWSLCRALRFPGPWRTYLGFYFVGMYFNLFLPTAIGGDVLKVHFLTREEGKRALATYSVLGDRLFGLMAMLMIGAVTVRLWPGELPGHFETMLLLGGIGACGLLGFPIVARIFRTRQEESQRQLAGLMGLMEKPGTLALATGLSLCLQILGMGMVAVLGGGLGIDLPLPFYFAVCPLVAIVTLLPISFSGIGLREGALVYFMGLKGIQAGEAATLGLLVFGVQAVASLIGGLAYACGYHRRSVTSAGE